LAQKKKKKKKVKVSKPKRFLLWLLVLLLITGGVLLFNSKIFDVNEIIVYGAERYNADSIIEASGITKGVNILKVDELAAKERLETEPFLEVLDIKRIFPATVAIYIEERTTFMQAEYNGAYIILDREGHALMQNATKDEMLLTVTGLQFKEPQLGKTVEAADANKYSQLMDILKQTDTYEITPLLRCIDMSTPGDLTLTLSNDICVKLGYAVDLDKKLALYDSAMEGLQDKAANGGTLDFSVVEKPIFSGNATAAPNAGENLPEPTATAPTNEEN